MAYETGKKSMWPMVLMYLLIGGIIYIAVYYLFFMKNSGYQTTGTNMYPTATPQTNVTTTPSSGVMFKTDTAKGNYLVGSNGMTLYIFDKDKPGVSNCTGACLTLWPAFLPSGAVIQQDNISVITRPDGTTQYAWKNMPLYYYSKDALPGDLTGDGFNGIWHIVKQ